MSTLTKGWCPSLEKPMETGDGLLVRLPIKFGRVSCEMARGIANLSAEYGNGHLDLSARGNLQIRGVTAQSYEPLRAELSKLGLNRDFALNIIVNPFANEAVRQLADDLSAHSAEFKVPEKYLVVIDDGGSFPLSALPCDLYIDAKNYNLGSIIETLSTAKKCDKKAQGTNLPKLGVNEDALVLAAKFGRIEAEELIKLADISDEIIFAPFRRVLLPGVKDEMVMQKAEKAGFITRNDDARLHIHACVGAPACSSGLGETRTIAEQYALDNPKLGKVVHITGCAKGCAYKGVADITITANKSGYETNYA